MMMLKAFIKKSIQTRAPVTSVHLLKLTQPQKYFSTADDKTTPPVAAAAPKEESKQEKKKYSGQTFQPRQRGG